MANPDKANVFSVLELKTGRFSFCMTDFCELLTENVVRQVLRAFLPHYCVLSSFLEVKLETEYAKRGARHRKIWGDKEQLLEEKSSASVRNEEIDVPFFSCPATLLQLIKRSLGMCDPHYGYDSKLCKSKAQTSECMSITCNL